MELVEQLSWMTILFANMLSPRFHRLMALNYGFSSWKRLGLSFMAHSIESFLECLILLWETWLELLHMSLLLKTRQILSTKFKKEMKKDTSCPLAVEKMVPTLLLSRSLASSQSIHMESFHMLMLNLLLVNKSISSNSGIHGENSSGRETGVTNLHFGLKKLKKNTM